MFCWINILRSPGERTAEDYHKQFDSLIWRYLLPKKQALSPKLYCLVWSVKHYFCHENVHPNLTSCKYTITSYCLVDHTSQGLSPMKNILGLPLAHWSSICSLLFGLGLIGLNMVALLHNQWFVWQATLAPRKPYI